jgi:hypothetical protein
LGKQTKPVILAATLALARTIMLTIEAFSVALMQARKFFVLDLALNRENSTINSLASQSLKAVVPISRRFNTADRNKFSIHYRMDAYKLLAAVEVLDHFCSPAVCVSMDESSHTFYRLCKLFWNIF